MFKEIVKKVILKKVDISTYHRILKSRASGKEKHILIACLPKSGSTFIANTICNITGYNFVQFQPTRATNDHNIDPTVLFYNLSFNTVSQLHLKPNVLNKRLILDNGIKVIYLYRGILESLKSFNNHIINENDQWFMFTPVKEYINWSKKKQFDFLIDMVLPWYINFITSWKNELNSNDIDIMEVDYDDFKSNNFYTIKNILKFYDLNYSDEIINHGLDLSYKNKNQLRFNEGRKIDEYDFTDRQINKIENILDYYSEYPIKL